MAKKQTFVVTKLRMRAGQLIMTVEPKQRKQRTKSATKRVRKSRK